MHSLGVIPARGGSKGLPRKNLLPLKGVPLIGWTISCAGKTDVLTQTLVSTDDDEIAAVAKDLGGDVPFRRPAELSLDDSSIVGVLQHAVRWIEQERDVLPDLIVLLPPTSPLRRPEDIERTIRVVIETGCTSAQTVARDDAHPWHRYTLDDEGARPRRRRCRPGCRA